MTTYDADWAEARPLLTDLTTPLEYLAKWEYATARRQAAWPLYRIWPQGDGYALEFAAGHQAADQVRSLLASDTESESDWILEPPTPIDEPVTVFDMRWDAEARTVLVHADDDALLRVGSGWQLVKVPLVFTRVLRDRLLDARDTEVGNAPLLLAVAGVRSMPSDEAIQTASVDGLNRDQEAAVKHALSQPVTLIWGPPGTGKTTVITTILRTCWQRGESVLLTSHTHQAVDEPLSRLAHHLAATESGWTALMHGHVQRWGSRVSETLRRDRVRDLPTVDLLVPDDRMERQARGRRWQTVANAVESLADDVEAWQQVRRDWLFRGLWTTAGEYWPLPDALRSEDRTRLAKEAESWKADPSATFADGAPRIVGATVTHAFLSMADMDWSPDVVIVDEVTMSHMPAIAAMALLAENRIVMAGDFWQLPAIRPDIGQWPTTDRASAARWIGRDVFAVHGMSPEHRHPTPVLMTLSEQHRMAQPICDLVNAMVYAPDLPLVTATNPDLPVWPDAAARLVLVDTTALQPTAVSESGSWVNPVHQTLIAALVAELIDRDETATIGIVTPFRPQARQLARRLVDAPQVTAATAHRFQGSERAIMILDPVKLGTARHAFLGDTTSARQLWNVAISRAQRQVILVAPQSWVGTTLPARLVRYFQRHGSVVDASALLAPAVNPAPAVQ